MNDIKYTNQKVVRDPETLQLKIIEVPLAPDVCKIETYRSVGGFQKFGCGGGHRLLPAANAR